MTLPDSNIWLAMVLDKHEFHTAVRAWMDEQTAAVSIFFCRATQQSVIRSLSTTGVLAPYGRPPLTNKAAWAIYEAFLQDGRIAWADEPLDVEANWKRFGTVKTASPKRWMDAYLAAFALTGGYQLVTTDKAFKQFKNLNLRLITTAGSD